MGEGTEHGDHLRAGGIRSEDQFVVPAPGMSVGPMPTLLTIPDLDAATRTGGGRYARLADDQVGVGDAHDIEDARRLGGIVGLEAVLEDLVGGIAAHKEMVAPWK